MIFLARNRKEEFFGIVLILLGVLLRLLPHPWNFTPTTAIALFSGVVLSPGIALTVPMIVMILSDLILGPHTLYALTWGSFFLVCLLGLWIRQKASVRHIFLGTLGASLLFFIVTNLGVFIFQDMYTKDFSGLLTCYVMALPFFRNMLLGDLFFTGVFFGIFMLALRKKTKDACHRA